MPVRYKEAQIAANTAVKLASFIGVSEHWSQVRVQGNPSNISVGDSASGTLGLDADGKIIVDFGPHSNAAEQLYIYNSAGAANTIKVLCT